MITKIHPLTYYIWVVSLYNLLFLSNFLSILLSQDLSAEEINNLSLLLTSIADNLALIASQKS